MSDKMSLVVATISLMSIWLVVALIPNSVVITSLFSSEQYSWETRVEFLGRMLISFPQQYTDLNLFFIGILSVLISLNMVLVSYYARSRVRHGRMMGLSVAGAVIGMLGIGCSACGSILLSTLFGIAITTSLVSNLPFGGYEFGVIGIFLILLSTYMVLRRIKLNGACTHSS